MAPVIFWNGIVKNESAIIARCVQSLLPSVQGAIVTDTGSTDGTPEIIRSMFEVAGRPCEIYSAEFVDFSQARNVSLKNARDSKLQWDYLLLCDADMSLVVENPDCWPNGSGGLAYDMEQRAGTLHYWNRRLLARAAPAVYQGPTHEYLDIPSSGKIHGSYFLDGADGSNRPNKIQRDIALLQRALDTEINPGLLARYYFYLANSYFDLGDWENAKIHYKRRVQLGNWVEEQWYAQRRYAHCLKNLGDESGFVRELLRAYQMRPLRAETLYDLAQHFRACGDNQLSLLFSIPGMAMERTTDGLFVDDYAYSTGLKEEFAICAYYDPRQRERGAAMTNALTIDPTGTHMSRAQARANQFWYVEPLEKYIRTFKPTRLPFEPPDGYVAMNPSVVNRRGLPTVLIRTVNYGITPEGRYVSRTGDVAADSTPIIRTRNWLVRLSDVGTIEHQIELHPPLNLPPAEFNLVLGFEDSRLFEWRSRLWTISTVRELSREGWCEQVMAQIVNRPDGGAGYSDEWIKIQPQEKRHEKNWMPWPGMPTKDDLRFVYRLGAIIDTKGTMQQALSKKFSVEHISGGSQVIQVSPKQYMAIVHEAREIPGKPTRYYQHRFVLLRSDGQVMGLSPPFCFHDKQIEFAAGLALFGRELMVSYGVRDEEAWTGTMDLDEVMRFIQ